ncbi:TetR/AcrR family transcriptional regulator [Thalassotalea euphylliae]|uniref:TetR/AcrR family transcriptional regulator n=1 Tax=Thalassotalea euphylliae TaxID=1655234 RepID=A0A3E0U4P6_9GAMM|nr:TetR/AcrR family transcriptional regulator [Thalassotalea euphylliae]REL31674.1 TetR/AcrR family transcriptional regulator [Thalassotalea euphylliae]
MARPSMAGQRREEILDALELCILEKGIQATSLENIAEKAQMKRTILRHYIGNRDQIIIALSERWAQKYQQEWQELMLWLPPSNRSEALLDALFTVHSKEMVNNAVIGEAIFSEAKRLPEIKAHQVAIMAEFISHACTTFQQDYPNTAPDKIELVAHALYANYLMSESLIPLKMVDEIHKLKQASRLLCQVLETN